MDKNKETTFTILGMTGINLQGGSLRTTIPKKLANVAKLKEDDQIVWIRLGELILAVPMREVINLEKIAKLILSQVNVAL